MNTTKRRALHHLSLFASLFVIPVYASNLTTFTAGSPISASQINNNFSLLNASAWSLSGTSLSYTTGAVGIGTTAPTTALQISVSTSNTALRITDTTQATNKALTSDANGNASWQYQGGLANPSVITNSCGSTNTSWTSVSTTASDYQAGGCLYVLPSAGTYFISEQVAYSWTSGCADVFATLTAVGQAYSIVAKSTDGRRQTCAAMDVWSTETFVIVVNGAVTVRAQHYQNNGSGASVSTLFVNGTAIKISN